VWPRRGSPAGLPRVASSNGRCASTSRGCRDDRSRAPHSDRGPRRCRDRRGPPSALVLRRVIVRECCGAAERPPSQKRKTLSFLE
jgi:hypothetical protein